MNHIFLTLANQKTNDQSSLSTSDTTENNIQFLMTQPEQIPSLLKKYDIKTVPTFLFFGKKRQLERLQGANARELSKKTSWLRKAHDDELLENAAKAVMKLAPVVLAIKGTIENPRCAFCRQVIEILQTKGILFQSVDVLSDEGLRDELRRTAKWDTYPMVFAHGKLIGGIDKIRELNDSDTLEKILEGESVKDIGNEKKEKEEKTKPNVSKINGATINHANNSALSEELRQRLDSLVKQKEVMLFMKGSPDTPRCGFSRRIVKLLNDESVQYEFFDILSDEEVRQGLKKFSNWPTFPQVYVKGELIGGLDILQDLAQNGELVQQLGI